MSTDEGPQIDALTHRLADTPVAFLAEPRIGDRGELHVAALVGDLMLAHGFVVTAEELRRFEASSTDRRNWLRIVSIAVWLAHDAWFTSRENLAPDLLAFLADELDDLAKLVAAELFTTDSDRREELARLLLRHLGLRPAGETSRQASDRLSTVDSVERVSVLRQMKAKRERAARLRKEMEQKKAREAAAKYSRE